MLRNMPKNPGDFCTYDPEYHQTLLSAGLKYDAKHKIYFVDNRVLIKILPLEYLDGENNDYVSDGFKLMVGKMPSEIGDLYGLFCLNYPVIATKLQKYYEQHPKPVISTNDFEEPSLDSIERGNIIELFPETEEPLRAFK